NGVFGRLVAAPLQKLLQPGFRILEAVGIGQRAQFFGKELFDNAAGCVKAAIKVYGPDDGFHGVGKNGLAQEPAAFELAGPQPEILAQLKRGCQLRQGDIPDQARPQAAQVTLGRLRPFMKKAFSNDGIQQAVAKKLKPLIVTWSVAAVGQRLQKQAAVQKLVINSGQAARSFNSAGAVHCQNG